MAKTVADFHLRPGPEPSNHLALGTRRWLGSSSDPEPGGGRLLLAVIRCHVHFLVFYGESNL